jgi:hypothetical protein
MLGNARCDQDEALLERLTRVLAALEPARPEVQEAACELLTWRTVDAELTELLGTPASAIAD